MPTFGPFATGLIEACEGQIAEKTTKHEKWVLGHLNPFLGDWAINKIDAEGVDEYRAFKVKESEARARAIERGKPKRNDYGQILRPLSAGNRRRLPNGEEFQIDRKMQWARWLSVAIPMGSAADRPRRLASAGSALAIFEVPRHAGVRTRAFTPGVGFHHAGAGLPGGGEEVDSPA